mgnify:CR=1 FL=1
MEIQEFCKYLFQLAFCTVVYGSKFGLIQSLVMFGLGGVFVEVLKDVTFRIVPLELRDAKEMIQEIKGYPLLEGYRGSAPSDINAICLLYTSPRPRDRG